MIKINYFYRVLYSECWELIHHYVMTKDYTHSIYQLKNEKNRNIIQMLNQEKKY